MSSMWMPGAKVMRAPKDGGSMTGGERLVTWHYFVANPKQWSATRGAQYLNQHGTSVHFTFHPLSGEWVQMVPANRAGRGLRNAPGGAQTNRRGKYNIQIEVMANSPHWWKDLTPAGTAGLARGMAYFRSLGIPDQWAGQPGKSNDTPSGKSGHTGHYNWVENNHHDYLSKAPWEIIGGAKATPVAATAPNAVTSRKAGDRPHVNGLMDLATIHAWADYIKAPRPTTGTEWTRDRMFVRRVETWLNRSRSGIWQRSQTRTLQEKGGARVDGIWGQNTTVGLQRFLRKRFDERKF